MKLFTLVGSPRKDGFSSRILNMIGLKGYWVYDLNIKPCIGCDYCKERGLCFIEDDMKDIYKEIESSDIIGVISPIYFMSVPGQLKNLIDRLQVYYFYPIKNEKKFSFVFMIGEQNNKRFEDYYRKFWFYIFKNIGINDFDFFLLGNVKDFDSFLSYTDIIKEFKSKIEVFK